MVDSLQALGTAFVRPILGNNYGLTVLLAACLYLGAATRLRSAAVYGRAVGAVVLAAVLLIGAVDATVLARWPAPYLRISLLALAAALLAQGLGPRLLSRGPRPEPDTGGTLPLTAAAFSVLMVATTGARPETGWLGTITGGAGAAFAFALLLLFYAGIRERLELSPVPRAMRGLPLALLTVGLIALAFLGLQGISG